MSLSVEKAKSRQETVSRWVRAGTRFEIDPKAKPALVWGLACGVVDQVFRAGRPAGYAAFREVAGWELAETALQQGLSPLERGEAPKRGREEVGPQDVAALAQRIWAEG